MITERSYTYLYLKSLATMRVRVLLILVFMTCASAAENQYEGGAEEGDGGNLPHSMTCTHKILVNLRDCILREDVGGAEGARLTKLKNALSEVNGIVQLIENLIEREVRNSSDSRTRGSGQPVTTERSNRENTLGFQNISLFEAVERENLEAIRYQLSRNNDTALNAIFWATWLHKFPVLEHLVEEGEVDVSMRDSRGSTPLHFASLHSDLDAISYLVKKGANLDAQDIGGNTPLHHAASQNLLASVKYLVGVGAEPNSTNELGNTPLHIASASYNLPALPYLTGLNGTLVNFKNKLGSTPFHWTVGRGGPQDEKIGMLQSLFSNGADLETVDVRGATPLHTASSHCSLKTVKFLVQNEVNNKVNPRDHEWNTPLHYAVRGNCDLPLLRYLVDSGADPVVRNKNGKSPLDLTKVSDPAHKYLVSRIVSKATPLPTNMTTTSPSTTATPPPPPTTTTTTIPPPAPTEPIISPAESSSTPLRDAIISGNLTTVRTLVAAGHNFYAVGENGDTAIHVAVEHGKLSVLKYFVEEVDVYVDTRNGDNRTGLHVAVKNNKTAAMSYLVRKGADVNARDEFNRTPLHLAAFSLNLPVIKYLVERGGARVDSKDAAEQTPLHGAVEFALVYDMDYHLDEDDYGVDGGYDAKAVPVVRYLLQQGADVNTRETYLRNSPLHSAANDCMIETFKLLVQNGADLNSKNKTGETPLQLAGEDCRASGNTLVAQ